MPSGEHLLAGLLAAITFGVAVVFGVRQFRQMRVQLGDAEEQAFQQRTARRRFIVTLLLGLVAILFASNYLTGLDRRFLAMGDARVAQGGEQGRPMEPGERATFRLYALLWIAILLLLLAIVMLVAVDMIVVRKHWHRVLERHRDDRREMLEQNISQLRRSRGYTTNGRHE